MDIRDYININVKGSDLKRQLANILTAVEKKADKKYGKAFIAVTLDKLAHELNV